MTLVQSDRSEIDVFEWNRLFSILENDNNRYSSVVFPLQIYLYPSKEKIKNIQSDFEYNIRQMIFWYSNNYDEIYHFL